MSAEDGVSIRALRETLDFGGIDPDEARGLFLALKDDLKMHDDEVLRQERAFAELAKAGELTTANAPALRDRLASFHAARRLAVAKAALRFKESVAVAIDRKYTEHGSH